MPSSTAARRRPWKGSSQRNQRPPEDGRRPHDREQRDDPGRRRQQIDQEARQRGERRPDHVGELCEALHHRGERCTDAGASTPSGRRSGRSSPPWCQRSVLPFADGGIATSPVMGPVGEAGPEVIIPLTRPQRARELAETSGLLDLLSTGEAEAPKKSGETTARRVLNRLAVNLRPCGAVTSTWRGSPSGSAGLRLSCRAVASSTWHRSLRPGCVPSPSRPNCSARSRVTWNSSPFQAVRGTPSLGRRLGNCDGTTSALTGSRPGRQRVSPLNGTSTIFGTRAIRRPRPLGRAPVS